MFNNIPKMIAQSLFLVKALSPPKALTIIRKMLYLWREFYIKTRLVPIVKEITVEFKYKDETLTSCKITNLEDLVKLMDKITLTRAEKGKDID